MHYRHTHTLHTYVQAVLDPYRQPKHAHTGVICLPFWSLTFLPTGASPYLHRWRLQLAPPSVDQIFQPLHRLEARPRRCKQQRADRDHHAGKQHAQHAVGADHLGRDGDAHEEQRQRERKGAAAQPLVVMFVSVDPLVRVYSATDASSVIARDERSLTPSK